MTILLIEPDKVLAKTYGLFLKKQGHSVIWQPTAQEAIQAFDKKLPDVIVLEIQLRAHSGIEFLFELRSYEDLSDIPVILLTNVPEYDIGLNIAAKQQLGIKNYLYKPHTSLQKLSNTINQSAFAQS